MRKLYESVGKVLDKVNYGEIWPGFRRFPFALYDENEVYLESGVIPRDNRFLGNTSIKFDGGYLAIWMVSDTAEEDSETLASKIAHEMFHAFQSQQSEIRKASDLETLDYPDDIQALDYPDDLRNYSLKHTENKLLAEAFLEKDISAKRTLLENYMSRRKFREGIFGGIIRYEYLIETIEGVAVYAELKALLQISPEKYAEEIANLLKPLNEPDDRLFDIRRMGYYAGPIFCLTAKQAGISERYELDKANKSFFEIVSEGITPKDPGTEDIPPVIGEKFEAFVDKKKAKFNEFHSSHNEKIDGDFMMVGYDPMNMIKLGGEILCSHFVMLLDKATEEKLFLEGPVAVLQKPGEHSRRVAAYIK